MGSYCAFSPHQKHSFEDSFCSPYTSCLPLSRSRSSAVISTAADAHPVVARPCPGGEKRRGGRAAHHEECAVMGSLLLPCTTPGVSLLAVWCLSGATPRGQPWTSAVTLLHGRNGLSARRMAVWWMFREPSLCRHVRRELLRNALLDFTPIIAATACHQRNYVETYSRYKS